MKFSDCDVYCYLVLTHSTVPLSGYQVFKFSKDLGLKINHQQIYRSMKLLRDMDGVLIAAEVAGDGRPDSITYLVAKKGLFLDHIFKSIRYAYAIGHTPTLTKKKEVLDKELADVEKACKKYHKDTATYRVWMRKLQDITNQRLLVEDYLDTICNCPGFTNKLLDEKFARY